MANIILVCSVVISTVFISIEAVCLNSNGLTAESQAFSQLILSTGGKIITSGNLSAIRDFFNDFGAAQAVLYEQSHSELYAQVQQVPINGVFNCDYEIPITAFIPNQSTNESPIIFFFHTGGFVFGNLAFYTPTLTTLAATFNVRLVYMEYRSLLDFPFPTQFDDCLAATEYVLAHKTQIFPDSQNAKVGILGDSRGSLISMMQINTLTASKIDFHIASSPVVSSDLTFAQSFPSFPIYSDPIYISSLLFVLFSQTLMDSAISAYGEDVVKGPQISPIYYVSASNPPTLIIQAQADPLSSGATMFYNELQADGVYSELHMIDGTTRFLLSYPYYFPNAFQQALSIMQSFLSTQI